MEKLGSNRPSASASFVDKYSDDQSAGKVIGTRSSDGTARQGIDIEGLIAIDNGALRIRPLTEPGWGRAGIAYGPYARTNGLAFAIFLVNGHNTSQFETKQIPEGIVRRFVRWLRSAGPDNPIQRLFRWTRNGRKKKTLQRFKHWLHSNRNSSLMPVIDENLALGWFASAVPADPLAEGNSFVMHAAGPDNGELWVRVGTNPLPVIKGVQNVPIYYVVILREKGAAYYAASLPNAHGLVAYPNMRPIAIDPFNDNEQVYAALYQSVLGQIGFWVDTRVYGAIVTQIPELATWYGTAHAADQLSGNGQLDGSKAEALKGQGGVWTVYEGGYQRTAKGVKPLAMDNLAVLEPSLPSGLISMMIEAGDSSPSPETGTGILWRVQDKNNLWHFLVGYDKCALYLREEGKWECVASQNSHLRPNSVNSLQLLDDGQRFSLYLNGKLLFGQSFSETRLQAATAVGIRIFTQPSQATNNNELYIRSFEAHPRSVPIPPQLDLGEPWIARGKQVIVADNFEGTAQELTGRITTIDDKVWQKNIGRGLFELTGKGAVKVRASAQSPNPGRTAYTIGWESPNLADVEVNITAPGSKRGEGEKGRGGLIFWQDADNYIIISTWLDDHYGGASISSFFYLNGLEELYDAVWTNVGRRVYWGIPYKLRVVFDGLNYTAYVNDEPVLYRALTDVYPDSKRLSIKRVGIVANWEWGNDTGSLFNDFVAKV